jgi:hypothetical protein
MNGRFRFLPAFLILACTGLDSPAEAGCHGSKCGFGFGLFHRRERPAPQVARYYPGPVNRTVYYYPPAFEPQSNGYVHPGTPTYPPTTGRWTNGNYVNPPSAVLPDGRIQLGAEPVTVTIPLSHEGGSVHPSPQTAHCYCGDPQCTHGVGVCPCHNPACICPHHLMPRRP